MTHVHSQKLPIFILSVEDELTFQKQLANQMGTEYEVTCVQTIKTAQQVLYERKFDFILLDRYLPDGDSLEWIPYLKQNYSDIPILLLTSDRDFTSTHRALELGAAHYLVKPSSLNINPNKFRHEFIDNLIFQLPLAKRQTTLERRACILEQRIQENTKHVEMIGRSTITQNLKAQIKKYQGISAPILILGESGTGKDLVAQLLHKQEEKDRPFVTVNCSAIAAELAEAELFGRVKGSYTGAINSNKGYIERANGGDLFLDEVGDIPYPLQIKLLRTLESGEYYPVGSTEPKQSQFRLICATNKNLSRMVNENLFRRDFYHRINGLQIRTSPLRTRKEDILDLAPYFLLQKSGTRFSIPPETLKHLMNLPWPGNVRDLKYAIVRAYANNSERKPAVLLPQDFITDDPNPETSISELSELSLPLSLEDLNPNFYRDFLKSAEKALFKKALGLCDNNLGLMEYKLGISKSTIYLRLKALGLSTRKSVSIPNHSLLQSEKSSDNSKRRISKAREIFL